MENAMFPKDHVDATGPRSKVLGFLPSAADAGSFKQSLLDAGFEDEHIELFHGPSGEQDWEHMMGGSRWGEQAEEFLEEGFVALKLGGAIFAIHVPNLDEGLRIGTIASAFHAKRVTHFGELVDTAIPV